MQIVRTRFLAYIALFLLPVFVLSACDSDSNGDDNNGGSVNGSFQAEISGDGVDESFNGFAWFGEYEDDELDEEGFMIWMSPSENNTTGNVIALITVGDRPGTGTFPIVNIEDENADEIPPGSFAAVAFGGGATNYGSTGGSLTITSSSSTRVEGTFGFTARGAAIVDDELVETDVTIEGSFNAVSGSGFGFPGL